MLSKHLTEVRIGRCANRHRHRPVAEEVAFDAERRGILYFAVFVSPGDGIRERGTAKDVELLITERWLRRLDNAGDPGVQAA